MTSNKIAVAQQFIDCMSAFGMGTAIERIGTEDFEFWSGGIGTWKRQSLLSMEEKLGGGFVSVQYVQHSLISDGDQAAAELETFGLTKSGLIYNNQALFFFQIRDGKVESIKAYNDSLHASQVLGTFLEEVHVPWIPRLSVPPSPVTPIVERSRAKP